MPMNNTALTEESAFVGTIALLARLIDIDLIWKVFVPTRQFEKQIWADALFKKGEDLFLFQLKVKKNSKMPLLSYPHFKDQLEDMFKLANNELNGCPVVVLGWIGWIHDWRIKLYLESFIRTSNASYIKESWYGKGRELISKGTNKWNGIEYDMLIVDDFNSLQCMPNWRPWNIFGAWKTWDLSILLTRNKVIIANDLKTLSSIIKENIALNDNITVSTRLLSSFLDALSEFSDSVFWRISRGGTLKWHVITDVLVLLLILAIALCVVFMFHLIDIYY